MDPNGRLLEFVLQAKKMESREGDQWRRHHVHEGDSVIGKDARVGQPQDVSPPIGRRHAPAGAIRPDAVALSDGRDRGGDHDGQALRLRRSGQGNRPPRLTRAGATRIASWRAQL